ncbi:MAG: TetR/AcrR family transcriptional regulator [Jatrophihabitans sp.]|uniref:TetR/AcrR family transcriptional regulator n=1 Tax=Jatrophihabitans sp. TaxID=1932789 RepID=UPI0039126924
MRAFDAARRCFARNGFHETSMQDLFAESGLSAGAVYRYFPSKDEVILAIADENMSEVSALIRSLVSNPGGGTLGETLATVLELISENNERDDLGSIALMVWAEAVRNPAIAERFAVLLAQMRTDLAGAVARRAVTDQSAGVPADALAGLLLAIVPGYILQLTLIGHGSVAGVPDAARALLRG